MGKSMKNKKIPLQAPPDFHSLVPPDLDGPSPTSSGMDMDNLSPEQAESIPDKGTAHVGYNVHRRTSETRIHPKTGEKTEHHSVHMKLSHFEPQDQEEGSPEEEKSETPTKEKKELKSKRIETNAQDAVRNYFKG